MSPAERQQQLTDSLLCIEDPQERLAYVQDRVRKRAPLGPEWRTENCRIQGCVTKVWLAPRFEDGHCFFEVDSESVMVRGMASLVAEVYSGTAPVQINAFSCTILAAAGLERRITPTRLHGLAMLEAAIKAFAASCA